MRRKSRALNHAWAEDVDMIDGSENVPVRIRPGALAYMLRMATSPVQDTVQPAVNAHAQSSTQAQGLDEPQSVDRGETASVSFSSPATTQDAAAESAALKVFVRLRPAAACEPPSATRRAINERSRHKKVLSVESDAGEIDIEADGRDKGASGAHSITLHDGGGRFSFDRVFPGLTSNRSVYEAVGRPLVMSLLEGYNATLLAYGQTGTGKTYTLGEPHRVDTIEEGLMPRMLRELFEAGGGGARQGGGRGSGGAGSGGAGERAGGRAAGGGGAAGGGTLEVSLQYYQLYLDRVYDLLGAEGDGGADSAPLALREDPQHGGVYVQGGTSVGPLRSAEHGLRELRRGAARLLFSSTQLNRHSSRSHAVAIFSVVYRPPPPPSPRAATVSPPVAANPSGARTGSRRAASHTVSSPTPSSLGAMSGGGTPSSLSACSGAPPSASPPGLRASLCEGGRSGARSGGYAGSGGGMRCGSGERGSSYPIEFVSPTATLPGSSPGGGGAHADSEHKWRQWQSRRQHAVPTPALPVAPTPTPQQLQATPPPPPPPQQQQQQQQQQPAMTMTPPSADAVTVTSHLESLRSTLDAAPSTHLLVRARLSVVDLAGSERVGRTGVSGAALSEAQKINTSLHALGLVISALAKEAMLMYNGCTAHRQPTHVPFRNSSLTRLLQESLGGSCHTSILVTISTLHADVSETRSSLQFGGRAARVRNRPMRSLTIDASALAEQLAAQLAVAKAGLADARAELRRRSSLGAGGAAPLHPPSQYDSHQGEAYTAAAERVAAERVAAERVAAERMVAAAAAREAERSERSAHDLAIVSRELHAAEADAARLRAAVTRDKRLCDASATNEGKARNLEARNEQLEQQAHTLSQMNEALEERVNALLQALQVGGRDAGGGGGGSCTGSGGGGGGTDVTGSVRGDGGGRGTSGGHGGGDDDMEQVVESLREELACETLRRRESEAVARAATAQATAAEQLLLLHGSPHKGPVLRAASPTSLRSPSPALLPGVTSEGGGTDEVASAAGMDEDGGGAGGGGGDVMHERSLALQRGYLLEATKGLRAATSRYEAAVTKHIYLLNSSGRRQKRQGDGDAGASRDSPAAESNGGAGGHGKCAQSAPATYLQGSAPGLLAKLSRVQTSRWDGAQFVMSPRLRGRSSD